MASIQEYCEMLSTSQLQSLLEEEVEGRGNLPLEVILQICEVLSERNPQLPPCPPNPSNLMPGVSG